MSPVLNVSSEVAKHNPKWDLQTMGHGNNSLLLENHIESAKPTVITTNSFGERGTSDRGVHTSIKPLSPKVNADRRITQTRPSGGGIIDLDSPGTSANGFEKSSSQPPTKSQPKSNSNAHSNALPEEELLPSTLDPGPEGTGEIYEGQGRGRGTGGAGTKQTSVQPAKAPKHGDVVTGRDGRHYRLLRGAPGPAGPSGRTVSLSASLYTVLGQRLPNWGSYQVRVGDMTILNLES